MLRMWTYDLAREQSPDFETLDRLCRLSLDAGYDAMGLYLEHRFAYPSIPWAAGQGAVTPDMIRELRKRYPNLRLIPFLNLLGHLEGLIYCEEGTRYANARFAGMQAEPTDPDLVRLCEGVVDDALRIFSDEWIHLGGDETWQLGQGERSEAAVRAFEADGVGDGKAELYGRHFGPLAARVKAAGRRPAVWGDMLLQHPDAMAHLPPETVIFDWQYFGSPKETAGRLRATGHDVVLCPTIFTYSALWCHLPQSERNVTQHVIEAQAHGDAGVCVTTWECGLFGSYETLLPALEGAGRILNSTPPPVNDVPYAELHEAPELLRAYLKHGENAEEWARLVGCELQDAGGPFAFSGHRSLVKSRLLLYSNPFLLWLRDRETVAGSEGDRAYQLLDRALIFSPDAAYRGVVEFGKLAIEFVRFAERAHQAYARGDVGQATTELSVCRQSFENLEKIARGNALRGGGSLADVERCRVAREHVERVIRRVKQYGDRSLGYLPSFETITHPKFVPHDQANWWLINRWGNE